MPNPESHFEHCEASETPQEKLLALKQSIEAETSSEGVEIGVQRIRVIPYQNLPITEKGERISPKEYFDYLVTLIETPEDIVALVNMPIVEWKPDSSEKDRLEHGQNTLANGGGDCDNISWLAKELLDQLSCKKGHDYKAKVVGMPDTNHAITIYKDLEGNLCSIDQWDHKKNIGNIFQGSTHFEGKDQSGIFGIELFSPDIQVRRSLDPKTLQANNIRMEVMAYLPNFENFTPEKKLPKDWTEHGQCDVLFSDGSYVRYISGKLRQKDLPNGEIHAYGSAGGLIQIDRANGDVEQYNEKTGFLTQKTFASPQKDGTIGLLYYEGEGNETIQMRVFEEKNEKEKEYYWPNGKVKQENYRNRSAEYKIVFYDETGERLGAKTWEGKDVFFQ